MAKEMESDVKPPIVIDRSPVTDQLTSLIRAVLIMLGTSLIARGWLPADADINALVGGAITVGAAAWGVIKATRRKQELVTAGKAAPDAVAIVR